MPLAIPKQFSQFHFFGQLGDNKGEHWEEDYQGKGNGMIIGFVGRGESLRIVKNRLFFREERLDFGMNNR
jgi:hypothetical protein